MKKMYRAVLGFGNEVKEFEIVRTTDKQVVFMVNGRERKEAKISEWQSWHETKKDALDYLVAVKNLEIHKLEDRIAKLKRERDALVIQYL